MPDLTLKWRRCPICGESHYGRKPVGDLGVYDLKGRKIATAVVRPEKGYAHLECIKGGKHKMLMLVQEPTGGDTLEAFNALDDAFGAEEFSDGQAVNALDMHFEDGQGQARLNRLVSSGCVAEV